MSRALVTVLRVGLALLWMGGASWKTPPRFEALHQWTSYAVDRPVFAPWAWFVEHAVLPNFTFFGWVTLIVEASLGAFLLVGLATRLWALLMHLALFATAAGRFAGLDGVLRPRWQRSTGRVARLLVRAS